LFTGSGGGGSGAGASGVGVYDVTDALYGATGDGSTDDTAAIQAALDAANAAGGGVVSFPFGTYVVSLPGAPTNSAFLNIYADTTVVGPGTIKVADGENDFEWIFAPDSFVGDTDNVIFDGLTVDFNKANNPCSGAGERRNFCRCQRGNNWVVRNCHFRDSFSHRVLNIHNNLTDMTGVQVLNNIFTGHGGDSNMTDASLVYVEGLNFVVSGNTFDSAGIGSDGVFTAIETHGNGGSVCNNAIKDYKTGIIFAGESDDVSQANTISGNVIVGALWGITLFSKQHAAHTTGYGFDGCSITGNAIDIAQEQWADGGSGIIFSSGTDLDAQGLLIVGNTITFELDTGVVESATGDFGIGWRFTDRTIWIENSIIANNTIKQSPLPGIKLSSKLRNVSILGNTLVDCGSSTETTLTTTLRQVGILTLSAENQNVQVANNLIQDNFATARMAYGIISNTDGGATSTDLVQFGQHHWSDWRFCAGLALQPER
jgi:hypothetical protein